MKEHTPAHAIVRYDDYLADVADAITVVAVVPTQMDAAAEVERLSHVNSGKRGRYFWTHTRYYAKGRAAGEQR